ncbi:MAG: uroporphyrinogen-III C-methyltransferase [Planctomycetes bacterium]|nr:uroporphyrinogen-III C-methyltransferase [Planctomycetota bacterium]
MPTPPQQSTGRVYLVGAGPGDPGLITLRGVECLRRADVVFYDYLVNPQILRHVPPQAERVCLGRHGRDRIMPQSEINARMVAEARSGRTVVRLKGGDPAIFGRAAEEVEALRAEGISYEIVPGITAALAAGSHAGIPVTHRDFASAVALVTGHQQEDESAPELDYAALAAFPGTLVFYMGITTAGVWCRELIAAGRSADTPAAIVRRCTWPDQETICCTLQSVADEVEKRRLRPPAIVIVGQVTQVAVESWFEQRPLFGQTVLVTRPSEQGLELADRLHELGAAALLQPAIAIDEPDDWVPVDVALARLKEFDWLVFSSANGVRYLMDRLLSHHGDVRKLENTRLAAIGPRTAETLANYSLKADLTPPEKFRAEGLAAELVSQAAGRQFLLARASRGRELLAEALTAAGAQVTQVVTYNSRDVETADPEIAAALEAREIDWITVTSSAIARSIVNLFGEKLRKARLASISPVTSATLRELGYPPAAEAASYTTDGLVEAILSAQP